MTEETGDMLFDPTMKKKKKKKAPINVEELDAMNESSAADTTQPAETKNEEIPAESTEKEKTKTEKVTIADDLDDFSSFKKKKKKKRGPALDMSAVGDALPTDDTESKGENKENESVEDDNREYTYDELLKRVFDIMRAKNPNMVEGGKRKFVMKPPQVVRVGTKKTSFVNFTDICKILHRQPKHLLAFLLAELGTSGTVDGTNQLIIKGKFQQKHIENVLKRYIKEYVTCHTCRSPETILHKETRLFFLQCETCGSRCSVQSIKSGFQAVTTKRAQLKNKQQ
ncbi:eukaryotic translation initiation factor 2 subunit 2-like [Hydractinia symbiolongicarpus]|uniref:eukaryotic translation initiation factor 2 subunit 2-like n=1 Tax=Hydractinia symbiolongicarpus TaxID=13093 RepID=UPI002549C598|nr:eukaryotic translation initiation factor 2 subunit 2-like [Hydractinia symbiolongicarpus]